MNEELSTIEQDDYGQNSSSESSSLDQIIENASSSQGVDADLIRAVQLKENPKADPRAESFTGARGLMQILPSNTRDTGLTPDDLWDSEKNVTFGAKLIREQLDHWGPDRLELAVASYYAGSGNVRAAAKRAGTYDFNTLVDYLPVVNKGTEKEIDLRKSTPKYVADVLGTWSALKQKGQQEAPQDEEIKPWRTVPEFAAAIQGLVSTPGFEAMSAPEKIGELKKLYESDHWVPKSKDLLREVTDEYWQSARRSEKPNFESAGAFALQIEGKTSEEIAKNAEGAKKDYLSYLQKSGIEPGLLGSEVDNFFSEVTKQKQIELERKQRGFGGQVVAFGKAVGQSATAGIASQLAWPAEMLNAPGISRAIKDVPQKLFTVPEDFTYVLDENGEPVLDDDGNPKITARAKIASFTGTLASILGPGAALKAVGKAKLASTYMIEANAFNAMDQAFSETRSRGGTYLDSLGSAFVAATFAAGAGYTEMSLISRSATSAAAANMLNGVNRYKAAALFAAKSATEGAAANVMFDLGIQLGPYLTTGKPVSPEDVGIAAGVGAALGAPIGAYQGFKYKAPPPYVPQPEIRQIVDLQEIPRGLPAPETRPGITGEQRVGIPYEAPYEIPKTQEGLPAPEERLGLPLLPGNLLPEPPAGKAVAALPGVSAETAKVLARRLEMIKASKGTDIVTLREGEEIPQYLLDVFNVQANRLNRNQVEISERAPYVPKVVNPKSDTEITHRINELQTEISDARWPSDSYLGTLYGKISELKGNIKATEKLLTPEQRTDRLPKLQQDIKDWQGRIDSNREDIQLLEKEPGNEQLILTAKEEITALKGQLKEAVSEMRGYSGQAKLNQWNAELKTAYDELYKITSSGYQTELTGKNVELGTLLAQQAAVRKANKGVPYQGEEGTFKDFAISKQTPWGKRFFIRARGKWYALDERGDAITSGHYYLGDAQKAQRETDLSIVESPRIETLTKPTGERPTPGEGLKTTEERLLGAQKELVRKRGIGTAEPIGTGLKQTLELPRGIKEEIVNKKGIGNAEAERVRAAKERLKVGKKLKAAANKRKRGKHRSEAVPLDTHEEALGESIREEGVRYEAGETMTPDERLKEREPNKEPSSNFDGAKSWTKEKGLKRTGTTPIAFTKVLDAIEGALRSIGGKTTILLGGKNKNGAAGYYKIYQDLAKVTPLNAIGTAAHEVLGHAVQFTLHGREKLLSDVLPERVLAGLKETAETFYYKGQGLPLELKFDEGFAVFMQRYLTGESTHKDVRSWFENTFSKEQPRLYKEIQKVKELSHAFYNQTPKAAVEASISAKPETALNKIMAKSPWAWWEVIKEKTVSTQTPLYTAEGTGTPKGLRQTKEEKVRLSDTVLNRFMGTIGERVTKALTGFQAWGWNGEPLADIPSAKTILDPVHKSGQMRDFLTYLAAKRWEAYTKKGKEPGTAKTDWSEAMREIESADAANVAAGNPSIVKAANDWWKTWDEMLISTGEASPAMKLHIDNLRLANKEATGEEHGFYIPIQRQNKGAITIGLPLKGSYRLAENPMLHVERVLSKMWHMADQSYLHHWLANEASTPTSPWAHLINEVTPEVKAKLEAQTTAEIKDAARNAIRPSDIKEGFEFEVGAGDSAARLAKSTITMAKPLVAEVSAPDGYTYMRTLDATGDIHYYEVPKNILKALSPKMLDVAMHPLYKRFYYQFARGVTVGATGLRTAFTFGTNLLRDPITAYTRWDTLNPVDFGKYVFKAFQEIATSPFAAKDFITATDKLQALGFGTSTLAGSQGFTQSKGYLEKVSTDRGLGTKILDAADITLGTLHKFLSIPEIAMRLPAGLKMADKLGVKITDKLTMEQQVKILSAINQSTTNFKEGGDYLNFLNTMHPFARARMAETVQLVRDWRTMPGKMAGLASSWFIYSMLHGIARKDDKAHQERDLQSTLNYMYFPISGTDREVRIPISSHAFLPWILGQYVADRMQPEDYRDAKLKDYAKVLVKGNMPIDISLDSPSSFFESFSSFFGPLGKELVQQYVGKDFHTERPIEPSGMQGLLPHERFTFATTELSKSLANNLSKLGIEVSPARIDHATRLFPAIQDYVRFAENVFGVKLDPGQQNSSMVERLAKRMGETWLQAGNSFMVFDRSSKLFYDKLNAMQERKSVESPQESEKRKKLVTIGKALSDVNVVIANLRQGKDRDTTEELKHWAEIKSRLFKQASLVWGGNINAPIPKSPKEQADRLREKRAQETKTKYAQSHKEESD